MNVGSLFAGIGGFDLGFERCGMRTLWQVEQDPYCRAVLARHFPAAERFEDVREVGAANLQAVDLICGGFPCQDLSTAGRGAGIDGARSGLWGEYARIVCELRPRYVVVENVPPLLTGKGKRWERAPIGRVLGDLAEMGYDAEWPVLSAREFGAPHLRKRVWIVAYPQDAHQARPAAPAEPPGGRARTRGAERGARDVPDADPQRRQGDADHHRQPQASRGRQQLGTNFDRSRHVVADADRERRQGRADELRPHHSQRPASVGIEGAAKSSGRAAPPRFGSRQPRSAGWRPEPGVGRVADGVPNRVDRLGALGNALLPQIAEWIGTRILAYEEAELRS